VFAGNGLTLQENYVGNEASRSRVIRIATLNKTNLRILVE
jgi:hypothetical protein